MQTKTLIIGLGLSGRAAAAFMLKRGATVSAVDQNRELLATHEELKTLREKGLETYHEQDPLSISQFDLVVVSPGVPPTNPHYAAALAFGVTVIGEVELASRYLTQTCLGITGSNGKTTTTRLVEHVLNNTGKKALAIGNVGVPITSALDELEENEILVAELSSQQLETLQTRILDGAVILNITPNHLDRHGTMEHYAAAKFNIKNCLKKGALLTLHSDCYLAFGHLLGDTPFQTFGYRPGSTFFCDQKGIYYNETLEFLLPESYRDRVSHDVENMLAAYALCRPMGVTPQGFLQAFQTFKKPPHRIEFVARINGVDFYDDSKGTSLDAVAKAVQSLPGQTILIAGGLHKGAPYTPWIKAFQGRVRCICAIGQAAKLIKEDVGQAVPVEIFESLESAVEHAANMAKKGENVLLSPGCASWDMFKDYVHRGDQFKRIVLALTNEGKQL